MLTKTKYRLMVSDRINECIKENKISKNDLAKVIKVTPSSVYSFTTGRRLPHIKAIVNMCYYFRIEIDDITFFGPYVDLSIKQEDNYEQYLQRLIFND